MFWGFLLSGPCYFLSDYDISGFLSSLFRSLPALTYLYLIVTVFVNLLTHFANVILVFVLCFII